ncbi:MAG: hypothetical protein C0399_05755 [Syntrophus sp. (in: bacteria)]|nr:hypothetical protein [Syntrophus sp. (in: bacteria)]
MFVFLTIIVEKQSAGYEAKGAMTRPQGLSVALSSSFMKMSYIPPYIPILYYRDKNISEGGI